MLKILAPSFVIALLKAILDGFGLPLPNGISQLSIDGKLMSVADIVSVVREHLGIYEAVPSNRGRLRDSLALRKERAPLVGKFINDLEIGLKAAVGGSNESLTAFGFKAPKERRQLTAEELAERAKKVVATRAARHTLGKRQKKDIHGADSQPKPNA